MLRVFDKFAFETLNSVKGQHNYAKRMLILKALKIKKIRPAACSVIKENVVHQYFCAGYYGMMRGVPYGNPNRGSAGV